MNAAIAWQKSSYSEPGGDCVELATVDGVIALREGDEPHVALTAGRAKLSALLARVKTGQLDHIAAPGN